MLKPELRRMLERVMKQMSTVQEEPEYGQPDISWNTLDDWEDIIATVLSLDWEC